MELKRDGETGLYHVSMYIPADYDPQEKEWLGTVIVSDDRQDGRKIQAAENPDGTLNPEVFEFSPHVSYVENSFSMQYAYAANAPFNRKEMVDHACDFLFDHGVETLTFLSTKEEDIEKMEEIGFKFVGKSNSSFVKLNQFVRSR